MRGRKATTSQIPEGKDVKNVHGKQLLRQKNDTKKTLKSLYPISVNTRKFS